MMPGEREDVGTLVSVFRFSMPDCPGGRSAHEAIRLWK